MKEFGQSTLQKKYKNCKTMQDYFNLINSSKIDYHSFFTAISKNKKTDCFRKITTLKNLQISARNKVADANTTNKILSTESNRLKKHNFNYGYDAYDINGDLGKVFGQLKIYNCDAEINAQHPGQIKALHYDSCAGWIKEYCSALIHPAQLS